MENTNVVFIAAALILAPGSYWVYRYAGGKRIRWFLYGIIIFIISFLSVVSLSSSIDVLDLIAAELMFLMIMEIAWVFLRIRNRFLRTAAVTAVQGALLLYNAVWLTDSPCFSEVFHKGGKGTEYTEGLRTFYVKDIRNPHSGRVFRLYSSYRYIPFERLLDSYSPNGYYNSEIEYRWITVEGRRGVEVIGDSTALWTLKIKRKTKIGVE